MISNIKKELKNKLICLKIDGVTRLDRCILGINCQFLNDGKIKILTLGLIQLLDKHTGSYLKEMVIYDMHLQKYLLLIKLIVIITILFF